ncbi:MAG TPA: O-methyltransferase [Tepidisphaeraceae bacterium]|jgi:predicted O-methyltransferase YrrM|nr:O-methyltransferase [Tepidisphaeraceae bacterium]
MTQEQWTAVDGYISEVMVKQDSALSAALQSSAENGLPHINVAANQGKLLQLLAQTVGAQRILEIGTLGGYSTIWLARALPAGGKLITLEYESKHAKVAEANIARAGLSGVVEIRVGKALDNLPKLAEEKLGPFDFIFIDADKENIPAYFDWSLKLSRKGTLIVVDNVIRKGAIIDAASTDASIQGVRKFNERVAAEPRVSATTIQTVGSKGYDGLAFVRVVS